MRIHLPRARGGEADYEIVSVNGKTYQILRGVDVDVPKAVAEVLFHGGRARAEADRFEEEASR